MSAFRDLILDAEKLGVTKLSWHVDVRGYAEDAGRWQCVATVPFDGKPVWSDTLTARGRTGEEALRELVCFLQRVA